MPKRRAAPLADKPLVWLHVEVKTPPWSLEARREAGLLLRRLQLGALLSLPASRPMPSIGAAVHELRIKDAAAGVNGPPAYSHASAGRAEAALPERQAQAPP